MNEALTFDDVLMVPSYSEVESRDNIKFESPIIPSNMKSISGLNLARFCCENNYPFILHRYASKQEINDFINLVESNPEWTALKALSVGVEIPFPSYQPLKGFEFINCGICIDVAHGHHKLVKEKIHWLKNLGFKSPIIAGNVCTIEGFYDLASWGANIIKVGVGNGSVCTTRLATGHGYPQWSAIEQCAKIKNPIFGGHYNGKPIYYPSKFDRIKIIADGGVRNAGDIAKAIGAGADYVMTGSLFAGTDLVNEGPYSGMASWETKAKNLAVDPSYIEGVTKSTHFRGVGSTARAYKTLHEGLKSAISYSGFDSLEKFRGNAKFIRVSPNTVRENGAHFND